jgi:hypothetical protein
MPNSSITFAFAIPRQLVRESAVSQSNLFGSVGQRYPGLLVSARSEALLPPLLQAAPPSSDLGFPFGSDFADQRRLRQPAGSCSGSKITGRLIR